MNHICVLNGIKTFRIQTLDFKNGFLEHDMKKENFFCGLYFQTELFTKVLRNKNRFCTFH